VIRRHIDHGARQRRSSQRIVGGRLDNAVRAGIGIANHCEDADDGRITGNHMHSPRTKGAGFGGQARHAARLFHPALQVIGAAGALHHHRHFLAIEEEPHVFVLVTQNAFRQAGGKAGQLKRLVQVRVGVKAQLVAQLCEKIENFIEADAVKIGHF